MRPRIAIPVPHSSDAEYARRALPQYENAVQLAGGEPIPIPLDRTAAEVKQLAEQCQAVLLPGSRADVDPGKYSTSRDPKTALADDPRDAVDGILLADAYATRKPVLGICYGLQSLNVFRAGSLVQHIVSPVNHEAGRKVAIAHDVAVDPGSSLGRILTELGVDPSRVPVNSSHHQSADVVGKDLRIVARCPDDGVIEAIEGTDPNHFVLAVQWHPERSVGDDAPSRSVFRALVTAAKAWRERL